MLRIFIAVAVGAAVGSLATLALQEPSPQLAVAPSPTTPITTQAPAKTGNELADLREENMALRQQLSLKDANARADTKHVKELVVPNDNAKNCEARIKDLMDFYAQKDAFLAEYKDMSNPAQFDAKLLASFEREEVNPEWSSATEKNISELLAKSDETRNIIPSSIRCRSASCELKIPVSDMDARNKAMTALSNPDFSRGLGFSRFSTKSALELVAGEMTIYIKNE